MIDRIIQLRKLNPDVKPLVEVDAMHSQNTDDRVNKYEVRKEGIQEEFFEKVKTAKSMIGKINLNNQKIMQLRKDYTKAIKLAQQKESTQTLSGIIEENRSLHQNLKKVINYLKQSVQQSQKTQPDEPQTRMKKNFYISITNQLTQTLKSESEKEDGFKQCVKDKVTRQVKLIDPSLQQDEIQKYVQDPQGANQMLQKKIYGQASVNLKNAVSDIQDKFRDIQKLEQAVSDCLHLFKELALLVQKQGQMIDDIEVNVNQTKDYMEKAVVHLKEAKQHHQCSKKLQCIVLIIAIIVLVIILAPILATSLKKA